MIKVIHIISDTNIGGAGRWLLNFLKHVDTKVFEIKVILPVESLLENEIFKLNSQDIKVIEVDGMGDRSFDISVMYALYKILKDEGPAIVHTHASLTGRIAAKLVGVRYIIHTKHCIDETPPKGVKLCISSFVNNILSDRVIAVSEAVKKNLIEAGLDRKKIITIYNGIEVLKELSTDEKEGTKSKWGISRDEMVISFVARLEEVKGHIYFIEAAHEIVKIHDKVKFLIIGTGSLDKSLRQEVKSRGLTEKIIFTGHVEDITELINITDVNVLPSLSEAFGLSIVEAMSLSIPCVATRTGGIPEIIDDEINGLLVPIRDSHALARAIVSLMEDQSLRREIGKAAKLKVEEEFTAKAMTNKVTKLYLKSNYN